MQAALVILVFSGLLAVKTTLAAQHVIGGSQGWEQSVDFDSWLSDKSFKVGDQLGMFFSKFNFLKPTGFMLTKLFFLFVPCSFQIFRTTQRCRAGKRSGIQEL